MRLWPEALPRENQPKRAAATAAREKACFFDIVGLLVGARREIEGFGIRSGKILRD
jgi:hypothetical protein